MSSDESQTTARDTVIPVAMFALAAFAIFVARDLELIGEKDPWFGLGGDLLLTALLHLPLIWRKSAPLTLVAFTGPVFAFYRLAGVPEGAVSSVAIFLAVFAAGAYSDDPRRTLWRAWALGWSALALAYSVFGPDGLEFVGLDALTLVFLSVGINIAFFAAAWLLGDAWRRRRLDALELARRAELLAAEREERARQAVVTERVRIARELHDVVAHHVSVMGVQAAGARRILNSDPERAAHALASVEESSRQAVAELHRLVGFLRSGEEPGTVEPQPTIDQIDALLDQVRATGHPIEKQVIGTPREVPIAVSLSAYRIVQESLTNVIKHAGEVPTTVVLTYLADALGVEVVNSRGRPAGSVPGTGRGQLGMSERAAMVGGTVEFGAVRSGGYRVSAILPAPVAVFDGGEGIRP